MGNFYTCTQILNDQPLSKEDFLKKFCEAMKQEGYAVCEDGEGEMEYSFSFADEKGCRWATLYSESYEEGNQTAKADTARIAGMLGTFCINTTVIDSDCAILELYDKSGSKVDDLIMGRADDYFGENIPEPERTLWEPLLNNGVSWEQFIEIVHGDYVFVEEGLAKLSGVLNNGSMFSEVHDTDCGMAFEKARPKITVKNCKSDKKLNIVSAFRQVFGEHLKTRGFVQLKKSKYIFGRLIDGEILQVVTIRTKKEIGRTSYSVCGGISTVYRKAIDLNETIDQALQSWLYMISVFYSRNLPDDYCLKNDWKIGEQSVEQNASDEEIINSMRISYDYFVKWMLPEFDCIKTLDDAALFMLKYNLGFVNFNKARFDKGFIFDSDESLLLLKIENRDMLLKEYEEYLLRRNDFYYKIRNDQTECFNIQERLTELSNKIDLLVQDESYALKCEEYKNRNKQLLSDGMINNITSTAENNNLEKKLTVNSAFKKVYEEKLKPFGFVRINNPYNYFIRNLNDEIISVITMISDKRGGTKRITVLGGIATTHRKKIDFSVPPESVLNYWLFGTSVFYSRQCPDDYKTEYSSEIESFTISDDYNNDELISTFEKSFEYVNKWTIPVLNEVKDTFSAAEYFLKYSASCLYFKEEAFQKDNYLSSNESLILARIKQQDALIQSYMNYLKKYNDFMDKTDQPLRKYDLQKEEDKLREKINIINSDEKYIRLLKEWEIENIMILNRIITGDDLCEHERSI